MPSSLWSWFGLLCSKASESADLLISCCKACILQIPFSGRRELIEKWLKEDKLECTEELGDIVRPLETKRLGTWWFFEISLMWCDVRNLIGIRGILRKYLDCLRSCGGLMACYGPIESQSLRQVQPNPETLPAPATLPLLFTNEPEVCSLHLPACSDSPEGDPMFRWAGPDRSDCGICWETRWLSCQLSDIPGGAWAEFMSTEVKRVGYQADYTQLLQNMVSS